VAKKGENKMTKNTIGYKVIDVDVEDLPENIEGINLYEDEYNGVITGKQNHTLFIDTEDPDDEE
jgi:hypothetical protein